MSGTSAGPSLTASVSARPITRLPVSWTPGRFMRTSQPGGGTPRHGRRDRQSAGADEPGEVGPLVRAGVVGQGDEGRHVGRVAQRGA